MSTFVWAATYGSAVTSKPNTNVVKFGDGYEQRIAVGINSTPRKWQLTFSNRPNATADAIVAFFKARDAREWFGWAPSHGDTGKWVCREWSEQQTGPYTRTVTATFNEAFDPS